MIAAMMTVRKILKGTKYMYHILLKSFFFLSFGDSISRFSFVISRLVKIWVMLNQAF